MFSLNNNIPLYDKNSFSLVDLTSVSIDAWWILSLLYHHKEKQELKKLFFFFCHDCLHVGIWEGPLREVYMGTAPAVPVRQVSVVIKRKNLK